MVVALGGDGTVNEVINGLLTDGVHDRVPALGLVPAGSTNVFAPPSGLPNDPIEATGVLLAAIRYRLSRAPVSLGQADDRYFTFAAGLGFDAADRPRGRAQAAPRQASTHVLFARVGVREFFATDRRHPQLHVELPDGSASTASTS